MIDDEDRPTTPEEEAEAQRRVDRMQRLLSDVLDMMMSCPFPDELGRISSIMGMTQNFTSGHHAVMSAVAIERLQRLIGGFDSTNTDVKEGEEFLLDVLTKLILSKEWADDMERDTKIVSVARALFTECSKGQLALLVGIGMVRLAEKSA